MPALEQIVTHQPGRRIDAVAAIRVPARRPAPRSAARAARRSARGVSLIELLVSLGIIAVLMTAIGSVMVLTGRAVGLTAAHAGEARIDDVVATIAAEQRLASRITERTAKSIAFYVDRDHDGLSDLIRYAWSGVAGDPLVRQVNGGVPVVVVRDVRRFNLSYLLKATPVAVPVPDVESADVLLYSHDPGSSAQPVNTTSWVAQYFKPNWTTVAPGKSVTGWRVTKVEVVASKALGSSGTTPWTVRVYSAGADLKPVLTDKRDEQTLGVTAMAATSTPTAFMPTGTFTTNTGLDPAKGMCVTIGPVAFSPSGYVGYDGSSTDAAGAWMTSSNAGVTYGTPSTTRDMRIRVWGRYKYPG